MEIEITGVLDKNKALLGNWKKGKTKQSTFYDKCINRIKNKTKKVNVFHYAKHTDQHLV